VFVRWDNLRIETDEGTRLPGYRDGAVVRRFDAPEALDMRFYEVRAKSALNRVPEASAMPFRWTINPYRGCSHACVYCFARSTHTYLDMDAGRDFEREIVVKVNVPEVLRAELKRPSWKGEHVAMGTNTDPYQWVEGRYKLMRGIWEALRDRANPCSVLTKSPLLLRDLDLMLEIAQVTEIAANLSIPTMDEKPWRASEPHTPSPRARMEAVAELNRAGIPAGILVAPLMPGINDDPHQVERILEAAGEAGATGVSGIALHLRGEVRGIFMDWLRSYRPDLVERYEALYARGAYAPREEQDRLRRLLAKTRMRTGHEPPMRSPADSRGVRRERAEPPGETMAALVAPTSQPDTAGRARGPAAPVRPTARPAPTGRARPDTDPPRPRAGRQEALF
jgi:DNA repair photolyase